MCFGTVCFYSSSSMRLLNVLELILLDCARRAYCASLTRDFFLYAADDDDDDDEAE